MRINDILTRTRQAQKWKPIRPQRGTGPWCGIPHPTPLLRVEDGQSAITLWARATESGDTAMSVVLWSDDLEWICTPRELVDGQPWELAEPGRPHARRATLFERRAAGLLNSLLPSIGRRFGADIRCMSYRDASRRLRAGETVVATPPGISADLLPELACYDRAAADPDLWWLRGTEQEFGQGQADWCLSWSRADPPVLHLPSDRKHA